MDPELFAPMRISFQVLKAFGLWQDGNQSWKNVIWGILINFFLMVIHIVIQLIYVFKAEEVNVLLDGIVFLPLCVEMLLKSFNFVYKIKFIIELVESLKALMQLSFYPAMQNRDYIKKEVNIAFSIYKFCCFNVMINCTGLFLVAIFEQKFPYKIWHKLLWSWILGCFFIPHL